MKVGLIVALVLAVYVVILFIRGDMKDRIAVAAAVGFGLLIPQVLAALSMVAGSASALFSAGGW